MPKLAIVPEYQPTVEDRILENKIHQADQARLYNTDPSRRQELEDEYRRLHASRSEEYVVWMEKQHGIYRG